MEDGEGVMKVPTDAHFSSFPTESMQLSSCFHPASSVLHYLVGGNTEELLCLSAGADICSQTVLQVGPEEQERGDHR